MIFISVDSCINMYIKNTYKRCKISLSNLSVFGSTIQLTLVISFLDKHCICHVCNKFEKRPEQNHLPLHACLFTGNTGKSGLHKIEKQTSKIIYTNLAVEHTVTTTIQPQATKARVTTL